MQQNIDIVTQMNLLFVHRAEIILVMLGLKDAVFIKIYSGEETPWMVKRILRDIGLCYADYETEEGTTQVCNLVVAADKKRVLAYHNAKYMGSIRKTLELSGWRKTAIDAFEQKEKRLEKEHYPEDLKHSPLNMMLSKDGCEHEARVVRFWINKLRQHAPEFYKNNLEQLVEKAA